jgi:hypothetical protein
VEGRGRGGHQVINPCVAIRVAGYQQHGHTGVHRGYLCERTLGLSSESEPLFDGSNHPPAIDPEELDRLKGLSLKELLEEARLAAVRTLLIKVQHHEASAAELAVLRNLLRDNGLIMGLDAEEGHEGSSAEAMGFHLPDLQPDDDDEGE